MSHLQVMSMNAAKSRSAGRATAPPPFPNRA